MQDDVRFILAGKNVQTLYNSISESYTCTKLWYTEQKLQCNIHFFTDRIQLWRAIFEYLKRFFISILLYAFFIGILTSDFLKLPNLHEIFRK